MKWFKLFLLNFVGILNDNFMKHCIVFISVVWTMPSWMTQSQLISAVSAALVLPYLVFSPLSGELAQRFEKQRIIQYMKLLEIPIVLLAVVGFVFENVWVALFAVLLMGMQSCIYSPAKYGLIRDVDGEKGAAFGSGMFEMVAFLAILFGTLLAAYIADHYSVWIVSGIMLFLAIIGVFLSYILKIKESPTDQVFESRNPIRFMVQSYRFAKNYKGLNKAIYGASLLWLLGGMLQMNVVLHCVNTLKMTNTASGIILSMAAIGIAIGCSVTGRVLGNRNPKWFIVAGLTGIALSLSAILLFHPTGVWLGLCVVFVAIFGGMFQIPCLTQVQRVNIGRKLGPMMAYVNLLTFIFVLVGTLIFSVTTALTDQNSYAVFFLMLLITVGSVPAFLINSKK